ncbi:MAG TPA: carboxypeptidase regulatory-like domain-containing protein [Polyangia bacterium]|jgi:plastocyanin|nr:carboxypeptidase regulatory-like domain-containing protein [Polyangia bacterium]
MRIATFVVTLLLASRSLAAGSIEGTIKIDGAAPTPSAHAVLKDAGVCGKEAPNEAVVVGKKGGLRNVVVFVQDAHFAGALAPVANAALDQRQCRYFPHVQALTVGTPLALMNNDAILHNVHANDAGMTVFNVAMPIKGQKLPIPMRKPGLMKLQCDAGHTWMNGWIYVFDHPFFAVTDDKGAFTIKDVPPGAYTVELWHEPADGQGAGVRTTARVTVGDGKPAKLDLAMKL